MITLPNLDETKLENVAQLIAKCSNVGDIYMLEGALGAGKTTFSSHFIKSLIGKDIAVTSPTFTLMNIYEGNPKLIHCDFYRIEEPEEIENLGFFDEIKAGITLVEWPQFIKHIPLKNKFTIELNIQENDQRSMMLSMNEREESLKHYLKEYL